VQNSKQRNIIAIFTIFGFAYLLSSLLRGVTAALAPSFVTEFNLDPTELGLLGGAYFLGVFFAQWGIGIIVNLCIAQSIDIETSYQIAFIILTALSGLSYIWFVIFDKFIALRNSVYIF